MGVTLDSIRHLAVDGDITLQESHGTLELKAPTLSQKIGAYFSTKDSVDRNTAVVNTLRCLVQKDPRYSGIRRQADAMLALIDQTKTIQGSQIRDLLEYFDALTTDEERFKAGMVASVIAAGQMTIESEANVPSGGVYGVPAFLATSDTDIHVLYNEKLTSLLADSMREAVENNENFCRYGARTTETKLHFDAQLRGTVKALATSGLPADQCKQILRQTITAALSKDDAVTMIERFQEIGADTELPAARKVMLYTYALGDTKGIVSDGDFAAALTKERGLTALDTFLEAMPRNTDYVDALSDLEFAEDSPATPCIREALAQKLTQQCNEGIHVTEETCNTELARILTLYDKVSDEISALDVSVDSSELLLDHLENLGGVPVRGFFTEAVARASTVSPQLLQDIAEASTIEDLASAMNAFIDAAERAMSSLPKALCPQLPDMQKELLRFAVDEAVGSLSGDTMVALFQKMETQSATHFLRLCHENPQNVRATQLEHLAQHLFHAHDVVDLGGEASVREDGPCDMSLIPDAMRAAYTSFTHFIGDKNPLPASFSAYELAQRANKSFDNAMQATVQREIYYSLIEGRKPIWSDYDKISVRFGGESAAWNYTMMQDSLSRLVTGTDDAQYSALSQQDRAKVAVLLAHVGRDIAVNGHIATRHALQERTISGFETTNPLHTPERSMTIDRTRDGDFVMEYTSKEYGNALVYAGGSREAVRDDSHTLCTARVVVPHAELERLSSLDWGPFKAQGTPLVHRDNLVEAREHLHEDYCCNADYNVTMQYAFFDHDNV